MVVDYPVAHHRHDGALSMPPGDFVRIQTEPLSLDEIISQIGHSVDNGDGAGEDPESGALVTFSGIVRATEGDTTIPSLDYEHYSGMAEQETTKLIDRARKEWPLRRVAIVHRVGAVKVGESSVIVAVSAGHRKEAFAAARFLIDELKVSVPIWKSAPRDGN